MGSPSADRVVIIECQAERVDLRVTGGAGGVAAVRLDFLPQRNLGALRWRGLDRLDVGRRGWGRPAEDRLAQPDATVHRAMPHAVGGEPEHRPHREQAAAMALGCDSHALEAAHLRLRQPVELAEPGVGDRPVGIDEALDRQILREHLAKELDGLATHALLEPGVVRRVELLVRRKHAHAVQLQPLPGKILDEASDLAVGQHPVDFLLEPRSLQADPTGRGEEAVVGHRAPEEIGEPGGEFKVGEPLAGLGGTLDEVEKFIGGQHAPQRHPEGVDRLLARLAFGAVALQVIRQFLTRHGPPPGAGGELLEMLGDHLGRRVVGRQQARSPGLLGLRLQGALPFDPVDNHHGEQAVALVVEDLAAVLIEIPRLARVGEDVGFPRPVLVGESRDDVGCDDQEVQLRRHVEIHLRLVDLRGILGGRDVELGDP